MKWKVRTISGAAGGLNPDVAFLEITTEAKTVEEIRRKVEALPVLLDVLKMASARLDKGITDHNPTLQDIDDVLGRVKEALAKSEGATT